VFGFEGGKREAQLVPIQGVKNFAAGQPEAVDFSLFWDAWGVVQEKYAGGELDEQAMVFGAVRGMVEALGDPYTVFMDPKENKRFKDDISGSFEGVGMEIGIRDRELQVISPLKGTPAMEAGLRPGDTIVTVDGTFTRTLTLQEAVSLIRGPRGSVVTLGIVRDDWSEPKDFDITRAVIEIPSLEWELLGGNTAYVALFQFSDQASQTFAQAANAILISEADRIILDLRNNPGGFLEVSVEIAGWFLERGQTVVIEDFGKEGEERLYKAQGNGKLSSYPLVILMNEGSASASEILAGALRDHKGAPLVGEKSFGKGSVQELASLKGSSALKVTVAKWLTPFRNHIDEIGLEPDYAVELTQEDIEQELDPQLDFALELVQDL